MFANSAGFAHYACYPLNCLIHRLCDRSLDGRQLINFTHTATNRFLPWCKIWADALQFRSIEYRKVTTGVRHQFVCLRGFRRNPDMPDPPAGSESTALWPELGSGLGTSVCRLERTACAESQLNAIVRTTAADYVNFFREKSPEEERELGNSIVLLAVEFREYRNFSDVLDICYSISRHPKARFYTLLQYNHFFFCWNVVLGLLRSVVRWEQTLSSQLQHIVMVEQAIDEPLEEALVDTASNLALVLAGTGTVQGAGPCSQLTLPQAISKYFRDQATIDRLRDAYTSALWTRDLASVLPSVVGQVLNDVADATTDLVWRDTGASSLEDLFQRDPIRNPFNTQPGYIRTIEQQVNRMTKHLVKESAWPVIAAVLATQSQRVTEKPTEANLSLMQKFRSSKPFLKLRLAPLGYKTSLRNAKAVAYDDNFVLRVLRVGLQMPGQLRHMWNISESLVSVVAAEMRKPIGPSEPVESSTSAQPAKPFQIEGIGENVLSLIEGMDMNFAELEAHLVSEIQWSVKRMTVHNPDRNPETLRMATLQLLMRLRQRGEELRFYASPKLTWRACLWYSIGPEIAPGLTQAVEARLMKTEPAFECKQLMDKTPGALPGSKLSELGYPDVEKFVQRRMWKLSKKLGKGNVGLAESCQKELEQAMREIWQDKRLWSESLN